MEEKLIEIATNTDTIEIEVPLNLDQSVLIRYDPEKDLQLVVDNVLRREKLNTLADIEYQKMVMVITEALAIELNQNPRLALWLEYEKNTTQNIN